ncbi:hypothetical protein CRG98_007428 [Punica granatum]|uniref:Uncharacterized protein n=1 Tax=Punica granatum TaxID=22663 RepID=A0A2I0KUK4_PUNGR|nr:hypothetical protein CRG98_007428 [Punica granatum]
MVGSSSKILKHVPYGIGSGYREKYMAQIDHGEASAVTRTVTDVHSDPHRGVQRREPQPAAPPPPFPITSIARRLTGLGPFLFLRRSSPEVRPIPAQHPQSSPTLFRAVSPSGGRSDPIRSDPIHPAIFFFIFTEKPLNFPN